MSGASSSVSTVEVGGAGDVCLVQITHAPHEGMILCRDHLRQITGSVIVAHAELSLHETAFWGYRCGMCGTIPVADRLCESESCRKSLPPQWPAIYCCNDCALDDL